MSLLQWLGLNVLEESSNISQFSHPIFEHFRQTRENEGWEMTLEQKNSTINPSFHPFLPLFLSPYVPSFLNAIIPSIRPFKGVGGGGEF